MSRVACIVLIVLLVIPCISNAGTIDVQIKGVDDGVKTTKQQDYKEAVLFAKREAIERAGVKIKALTTVKDMVLNSDYIESKAEAVLLPGYNILDMGYSVDGTYQIVLVGKVKTVAEGVDTKELRYAKSVMERGDKSKAKNIINNIIKNSKDDNAVAEAMYYQILWRFASNEIDTFEKLKAYYPNSKYVSRLETVLAEREAKRKRLEAEIGKVIGRDGRFIAGDKGVVLDTKTGLMWGAKDNGRDINWYDAKRYCENYWGGGYSDWRMPTQDELASIYDPNKKNRHGFHVTKLLDISACCPWASDKRGSEAAVFKFIGGDRGWLYQYISYDGRAFPVRGGN
jgi:hypothetical protein